MQDQWNAYACEISGQTAWIVFNETLAGELSHLDLPNLLRVQMEYAPDEQGRPQAADEERMLEVEAELEDWLAAIGGRFAGQVTAAGLRTLFFYVACNEEEARQIVHRIALRLEVPLAMRMEADARHAIYYELLLPDEEERRVMADLEILDAMMRDGDDLQAARPVCHEASFTTHQQAMAFADWARQNGFLVNGVHTGKGAGDACSVRFQRTMRPEPRAIHADTAAIAYMTGQLGGRYEGWRAPLHERRRA